MRNGTGIAEEASHGENRVDHPETDWRFCHDQLLKSDMHTNQLDGFCQVAITHIQDEHADEAGQIVEADTCRSRR